MATMDFSPNKKYKRVIQLELNEISSEVVNAMMQNQIRIKYQILIPESYFLIRDPVDDTIMTRPRRRSRIP